MDVRPSVRHKNSNVELFSETIKATVTKFGTKVLCDEALQNSYSTMTFTQGQGKKGQGQRSPKIILPFFYETIKDTDNKFGASGYMKYGDLQSRSMSKMSNVTLFTHVNQ